MKKNKLKYVLAWCILCAVFTMLTIISEGWFLVTVGLAGLLAWAVITITEFING